MPLNLMEAKQIFVRQAERDKANFNDEVQRIEAMQMGVQVIEGLMKRNQDLEAALRKNNIPVPGDPVPLHKQVTQPKEVIPAQEDIEQARP